MTGQINTKQYGSSFDTSMVIKIIYSSIGSKEFQQIV